MGGVIIAGHTRYKAAKKLDYKEVPIVVADSFDYWQRFNNCEPIVDLHKYK